MDSRLRGNDRGGAPLSTPFALDEHTQGRHRPPRYGSAVLQALITIWAASTFLGPVRLAAGMAVTDELLFKEGVQFVDDEVIDSSVPEIRREDFALYRLVDRNWSAVLFVREEAQWRPATKKARIHWYPGSMLLCLESRTARTWLLFWSPPSKFWFHALLASAKPPTPLP